jgi:hypothetical protein
MKLRYKMNLIAAGYCGCGALVMAIAGNLGMSMILVFLSWFNWTIALKGEEESNAVPR